MRIVILVECLAQAFTSGMPYRGMLRELMKLRSADSFSLVVLRNSANNPLITEIVAGNENCELIELPVSRRASKLASLFGVNRLHLPAGADCYVTPDLEYFGRRCQPQIAHIADLSSTRNPRQATLNWIGRRLKEQLLQRHAKGNSLITTISEFSKQDIIDYDARFSGRVVVSYNGIDDFWFAPTCDDSKDLLDQYGVTEPYFVWWGFVSPRKNVEGLIKGYGLARKQLRGELPGLLIVGEMSKNADRMRQMLDEDMLTDSIRLMPSQGIRSLQSLVGRSEGLLFPSFYEGFGVPVVEAMATGRPVMASDVSSLREVSGGLGFYCDPSAPESIANAIIQMHETRASRDAAAFRQWASRFTHRANAERYSQILDAHVGSKTIASLN